MARATILGLAKLQRKLKQMPQIAKDEIRRAMEQGAAEMTDMMRSLVPKDSHALERSIGWTWGRAPRGSMVIAVAKSKLAGDLTLTIYAGDDEAYYARWVEFGTQNMASHPYFFVSYRANRKRVVSRIRRATTKAAKKVAAS